MVKGREKRGYRLMSSIKKGESTEIDSQIVVSPYCKWFLEAIN
jgi:hypothetical protein